MTEETTAEKCNENWENIRRIVKEELPTYEELSALMRKAGCAMSLEDIHVAPDLGVLGLEFHPYMRHRMTLMRLIPMMENVKPDYASIID